MILIKDVQDQFGNIANIINLRQPNEFSSKIEMNSREHVDTITLRSGK